MNPIIAALGIETFQGSEEELLKKILNDNLVALRAQELMVQHWAEAAIRKMHPVERQALIKRVVPPPPVEYKVFWRVEGGLITGKPLLMGSCGRCGQTCHFDGKPAAASSVVWPHCSLGPSKPTESAIEEYKARFNFRM